MKSKQIVTILSALITLWATDPEARAASIRTTPEKAAAAVRKAAPGDSIIIADGTYVNIRLVLQGDGEQGKPIVVAAETPGKVIFEGESNLRIAGKWLVVSGFWFRNGCSPTGTVHRIPAGHAPRHRLPRHRVRDRGVQPREPPDQRQLGAVLRTPATGSTTARSWGS